MSPLFSIFSSTGNSKKRSGSFGRHRRKKEAGSSSKAGTAKEGGGSEGNGFVVRTAKTQNIILAPKSKVDVGKARSRKSGGGSKGRRGKKGEFFLFFKINFFFIIC